MALYEPFKIFYQNTASTRLNLMTLPLGHNGPVGSSYFKSRGEY